MWTETITIRLGTRFEAQADLVWVVFQQKFDLNAEKYCRHNDNGGKEVCELLSFIVICAMLLIQLFFTNTIQRFLLLCDGTVLGDESNKGVVTAHLEESDRTG